jgi:hypothetical protein
VEITTKKDHLAGAPVIKATRLSVLLIRKENLIMVNRRAEGPQINNRKRRISLLTATGALAITIKTATYKAIAKDGFVFSTPKSYCAIRSHIRYTLSTPQSSLA